MIRRAKNPPQFVFCNSEICTPRGVKTMPHRISANCETPVTAKLVVCDKHTNPTVKFIPHRENFKCRNATLIAVDTEVAPFFGAGADR